ncbi:XcbB/CpsF family capsular polysaccharide biosynthesis protein [Paenarthrobacter sp. PH39-S1]|uniref:XcbB/CpsF family capsular polysaccharide biosynthesis protein n=1 Tax=Paenarthrobacter sp. PH39-S1 TaxID=3046204 RepID=UPI0024BA40A4|nr:XcbB/CpsF family capsular polysaccharide biosynthesis protein [Paenarthrobacter sp. PH39-S1]MDJ0356571.1 XcbB/CpsF family capsular polysaccharide biosynthesis protein [Paenarthrobacter sp. PH39-S1]
MNEIRFSLADSSETLLNSIGSLDSTTNYIEIGHAHLGKSDESLLDIARRDLEVKQVVSRLAMNGFYVYRITESSSRLVRDDVIAALWHRVKEGEFTVNDDNVVFSYTAPALLSSSPRLLVIFSSMSAPIYKPNLMRYFEQNFRTAQKYMPQDTAILRIADIGGVVGAFYLDTARDPGNTKRIQRLITETALNNEIALSDVLLYGASKGGTGALYHGLTGGFKTVAVDPIVSDEYYLHRYNDSHFTADGVFNEPKDAVFKRLVNRNIESDSRLTGEPTTASVIYSERSPQYSAIETILASQLSGRLAFFNCINPKIQDHPDVSPNSLNTATMLMNMMFYNQQLNPGVRRVI